MLKNTKLLLALSFLLSCFIYNAPLNCMNPKTEDQETKHEAKEEKDFVKVIRKAGWYTLGYVTAISSIALTAGLCIYLKSLHDIKNSYTKNLAFSGVKQAINYFSSVPQLNRYIIPGIAYILGANAILSLVGSVSAFKAGKKIDINATQYAKENLLPKIILIYGKFLKFLHITY